MHVPHPGLITLSAGMFAALASERSRSTAGRRISADTPLLWIGSPPADEDDRVVWTVVTAHAPARYADVVAQSADRLFRRDLARLGMTADIGFFQPLYQAYARDVVRRLVGTSLSLHDPR